MMQKFYKTTFTIEILSEEAYSPDCDIHSIAYEITDGDSVGQLTLTKSEELNFAQIKAELIKMGNDGNFFENDI